MPFYATVGPICMLDDICTRGKRRTEMPDGGEDDSGMPLVAVAKRLGVEGYLHKKRRPIERQKRLQPRIGGTEFSSKMEDGDARWRL